jgi:hypothetical protein
VTDLFCCWRDKVVSDSSGSLAIWVNEWWRFDVVNIFDAIIRNFFYIDMVIEWKKGKNLIWLKFVWYSQLCSFTSIYLSENHGLYSNL